MRDFVLNKEKQFLRKRLGSMSQLAGLKKYRLSDGRADGVEAVDVRTGTGFSYTVLPGRGMDIAWTEYKGVPISYMSSTGVCSANYYDSNGMEWLRNFFGGMLTTCGFGNVGGPSEEEHPVIGKRALGLHGRITNIPASEVCTREDWVGDEYVMTVSGKVKESALHGENISLRRTITSALGENKFVLRDRIENESNRAQEFMLLYHINLGYPILDKTARLVSAPKSVVGASDLAEREKEKYATFDEPVNGYAERCYFNEFLVDGDGKTFVAVINDELELAVVVSYYPKQLPCFTEWKMLNEGEYVLGVEPGTNNPIGRANAKRRGALQTLEAGETRDVEITVEVLDKKADIERIENKIKALKESV